MKENLHPEYHLANVVCACGNKFQTRSTLKEIKVEICSNCHPFFTGKQKLLDTAGRIEKFQKKYAAKATETEAKASIVLVAVEAEAVEAYAEVGAEVEAKAAPAPSKPSKAKTASKPRAKAASKTETATKTTKARKTKATDNA